MRNIDYLYEEIGRVAEDLFELTNENGFDYMKIPVKGMGEIENLYELLCEFDHRLTNVYRSLEVRNHFKDETVIGLRRDHVNQETQKS